MLLHQISQCIKLIVEAKDKHLAKLSPKLDNPDTAPKTYWCIINRFLNNKKIPILPPVFFKVNQYLISRKKLNFLIITLSHNVPSSKMQQPYQTLNIKSINN